jgi:hypothetical protein
MIRISWTCNLDNVSQYEKFPASLAFRPQEGDLVQSLTRYPRYYNGKAGIEFKVIRCIITGESSMEVEIHLVPTRFENILAWEKWYRQVRGF